MPPIIVGTFPSRSPPLLWITCGCLCCCGLSLQFHAEEHEIHHIELHKFFVLIYPKFPNCDSPPAAPCGSLLPWCHASFFMLKFGYLSISNSNMAHSICCRGTSTRLTRNYINTCAPCPAVRQTTAPPFHNPVIAIGRNCNECQFMSSIISRLQHLAGIPTGIKPCSPFCLLRVPLDDSVNCHSILRTHISVLPSGWCFSATRFLNCLLKDDYVAMASESEHCIDNL